MSGPSAHALADLFTRHPTRALVTNLTTRCEAIEIGGHVLPLTINEGAGEGGNCYVCRPSAAYIDYAMEETRHAIRAPSLRAALGGLIRAARPLVTASGLDRHVQLNNWMLSTNPAPRLRRDAVLHAVERLMARFPYHAILMRSLNRITDGDTMAALEAEGFVLLPARRVWLFDGRGAGRITGNMRHDRRLLRRTSLERVEGNAFDTADHERCAALYEMLYVRKYTPLNPRYTPLYMRQMQRRGLLRLIGLRDPDDGRLVAVAGIFAAGPVLTLPVVGYDTGRPRGEGLYRMAMAIAQNEAMERDMTFHMSAGAGGFKRLRGARPVIEYTAAYVAHLSARRRTATRAMAGMLARVGVPVLNRFDL